MKSFFLRLVLVVVVILPSLALAACTPNEVKNTGSEPGSDPGDKLVIYSGRGEDLVGPIIAEFESTLGIPVEVRYGDTAEMVATILEEGENSPADVFYGQDAGALGALAAAGRTAKLDESVLSQVEPRFRSSTGDWVGITGRARVFAYNTERRQASELPATAAGFCDETWQGRVGWAPTNASFQAFVTALWLQDGQAQTGEWLACMLDNGVKNYANNTAILDAVGSGDIDVGLVNHYYLMQYLAERPDFPVRNYFPKGGDASAMVNVSGAAILSTADNPQAAQAFIDFLLATKAQAYFAESTYEYPLADGAASNNELRPLTAIETPALDLGDLKNLETTLDLLRDSGVL